MEDDGEQNVFGWSNETFRGQLLFVISMAVIFPIFLFWVYAK